MAVDVIDREPTLEGLAEAINREHGLAVAALGDFVAHAIACGDALLAARRVVGYGSWQAWTAEHIGFSYGTALGYMRASEFQEEVAPFAPESLSSTIRLISDMGLRSNRRSPDHREDAKEVRNLYSQGGVTRPELAATFGVSLATINYWLNPTRSRQLEKKRRRSRQRERAALLREERDEATRRFGGGISEAYSLIRKATQVLDGLGRDGESLEIRTAANSAMRHIYRAEDDIVRAAGIEVGPYQKRDLRG